MLLASEPFELAAKPKMADEQMEHAKKEETSQFDWFLWI